MTEQQQIDFDTGYTGLVNLGQTCYMNSVVQCLYHTKLFREFFLGTRFEIDIRLPGSEYYRDLPVDPQNPELGNRALNLGTIICLMWSSKFSSLKLINLRNSFINSQSVIQHGLDMSRKDPGDDNEKYSWSRFIKQDSNQFFLLLMDLLDEDLKRDTPIRASRSIDVTHQEYFREELKSRGSSRVREIFFIQMSEHLKCSRCGREKITEKGSWSLDLPVGSHDLKAVQVNKLIDYWHKTRPSGVYCEHEDHMDTNMDVTKTFWRFPPILVIQILRVDETQGDYLVSKKIKNQQKVIINENLDLTNKVHGTVLLEGRKKIRYQLYAMIHHKGPAIRAEKGHFFAFARYGNKWRKYDDSVVTDVTKEEAITDQKARKHVYTLFYELI